MTDILTAWCPDCKVEMNKIVPDDNENYYKCPKCGYEITEAELLEEQEGGAQMNREQMELIKKNYDDFLNYYYNSPCSGCPEGHSSFWKTVIESPQWKAWVASRPNYDIPECEALGIISKEHFQDFLRFARSEDTAILARKMMGLEEVIRRVPLFEDGIGQDEGYNVGVEINEESVNKLSLAITQHLKGEGR
jgi:DNA-directed RNA polymerase subunit M/transcription elongation factor TFIIS